MMSPLLSSWHDRSCRHPLRVAALFAVLCGLPLSGAVAQLPLPQLNTIYPPGAKQGTSLDVTIAGANLEDATHLIFSHPGITAAIKTQTGEFEKTPRPIDGNFTITIAAEVPTGIYEARTIGRYGVSNPRAFMIGRYDEVNESGNNKSPQAAMPISIPTTINGRAEASSLDYFKLSLKQGQRVLIDCRAQRIDSRMDTTLVLLDANGGESIRNRDTWGTDASLDFTAPVDGDYVLGVYDFLYRGSNDYFYRLTVHSDPQIDFILPPAGLPGSNDQYTIYGRNLPGGKPADGQTIEGVPLEMTTVNIQLPGDGPAGKALQPGEFVYPRGSLLDGSEYRLQNSNVVFVASAQAPVVREQEPNDSPATATKVTLPCEVAGQFYPARDLDWIQFEAKKGDVYRVEVISHRAGAETDPILLLQRVVVDANGEEKVSDITSVDDPGDRAAKIGSDLDTSSDDPLTRFAVPENGTYRIMVRDQFGDARSDARNVYRLIIRPEQPDFRVVVATEAVRAGQPNANLVPIDPLGLQRGGTAVMKLFVDRRDGFTGEVQVNAEGLPPGVQCPGALIGAGSDTGWLLFTADENAAAWAGPIRIVGKAAINNQELVREARHVVGAWGTANRQAELPIFRVARDLVLSVSDKLTVPATVQIGDGSVLETSLGATLEVPVKISRRNDFKAEIKLVAIGAPNEIKPGDVTIKGDANDGKVTFTITNAAAKADAYTLYWKADAKANLVVNPDVAKITEERLAEVQETITQLDEQIKQADEEKNAATKSAQEAADAVKQAQDSGADEKAVAEAQAKAAAAQEAVKQAEQKLKDAQDKQKRATPVKQDLEKRAADLKKANTPKEVNFALVSSPVLLRIAKAPFKFTEETATVTAQPGENVDLSLTLQKQFGFDDAVEITLEPPQGTAGLAAQKLSIAKGQADGKLQLNIANNATPGTHTAIIRAKAKFNNVNVEAVRQVVIQVEKAS